MSSLNVANGDINHINFLSENIGILCLSDDYSDVTLIVEGERFPAHKIILAARSEYFRALLFGGMRESQQNEVELKGATIKGFKVLLEYIYKGFLSLDHLKEDVMLDVLGMCHQYVFRELELAIGDYLRDNLNIRNVCGIFDSSRLYNLTSLTKVCISFIDRNACDIIKHDSFTHLSSDAIRDLLTRDSFCAPEVDIFKAVCNWSRHNPDGDISYVLKEVRLPLMSIEELLSVVRPAAVVSPESILDAVQTIALAGDTKLRYRGCLLPEENVASPSWGTTVLQGEMRAFLLDGNTENYDMERGYTRHTINEGGDHGIVIRLGVQAIINHIKMLLWDKDLRSYSYYIEVSMNQKEWTRVVDHTSQFCRSWQFLYFPERVVRYVRIVGTNNTVNKVFHVVAFEAMYSVHTEQLERGFIVPKENVATIKKSAAVLEGVSRFRNTLINGEIDNYNWDLGYTCHQLGNGHILLQLGQPYMLSSLRLLLWDMDDRSYSYYIETSVNKWEWEMAVDKSNESCRSWQTVKFSPRPVVFIKLVGTHNSANEVFHCVHLECPARPGFEGENSGEAEGGPVENEK